ncbi:hypothetical protein [Streptomyces bohaiensis]|uniref:Uncharacterized protein n=1 Tax=Streptomyces bohaiensis TaxID=1431344 RepID=A0ABX1CBR6_9ACTN|nr:hypothetical protein [Streptomyces bohaiensis]NJQ15716.1 hypothetical protein [Streptomyces bohaiensis]
MGETMDDGEVILPHAACSEAQTSLNSRGELGSVKERFAQIASAQGLFGDVPGGEAASAALERAALSMLEQLHLAGVCVQEIAESAGAAAAIATGTDEAWTEVLRIGPHVGWSEEVAGSDGSLLEEDKFAEPVFADPMTAFEDQLRTGGQPPDNVSLQ